MLHEKSHLPFPAGEKLLVEAQPDEAKHYNIYNNKQPRKFLPQTFPQ